LRTSAIFVKKSLSAILLTAFAYGASALVGPIGNGVLHGLKLVAVAIVAQAVFGMARTLCPDRERSSIAGVAALMILFSTSAIAQLATIVMGGIAGLLFCRAATSAARGTLSVPVSRRVGIIALSVFFLSLHIFYSLVGRELCSGRPMGFRLGCESDCRTSYCVG
jgi:chromate transporter